MVSTRNRGQPQSGKYRNLLNNKGSVESDEDGDKNSKKKQSSSSSRGAGEASIVPKTSSSRRNPGTQQQQKSSRASPRTATNSKKIGKGQGSLKDVQDYAEDNVDVDEADNVLNGTGIDNAACLFPSNSSDFDDLMAGNQEGYRGGSDGDNNETGGCGNQKDNKNVSGQKRKHHRSREQELVFKRKLNKNEAEIKPLDFEDLKKIYKEFCETVKDGFNYYVCKGKSKIYKTHQTTTLIRIYACFVVAYQ